MVGRITGESIKSAIALKLKSSFATTSGEPPIAQYPKIYKERVVQNLIKPSFFIWVMDVDQVKLNKKGFKRDYQMNVRYQPEDENERPYEELSEIGNQLLEHLSSIEVPIFLGEYDGEGNPIEGSLPVFGKQMSFTITDGVLQMFATYSIRMIRLDEADPNMGQLTVNTNI